MTFAAAWLGWVLVPLFALWAGLALWTLFDRRGFAAPAAVRFSSLTVLKRLAPSGRLRLRTLVRGLRIATIALLLLAITRPQTGRTETRVVTEGIDIILALDTSGSMQALDLDTSLNLAARRNRLGVVKEVVGRFIEKRPNDQLGMVVFGAEAFTQCPLTLDHGILATFLDRIEIGMAGDRTAIGSALGVAVKRLQKSKAKSKVVILLTDGRNNAGSLSPRTAAEVAKSYGIKVYTIGAGTRGKAPFIQETMFGPQVIYEDVAIDEALLAEMAELTGGAYFRAEDAEALASIYTRIDELEKTEIEMKQYQEYNERYAWFVWPALLLLLVEVLLLGTWLRKLP